MAKKIILANDYYIDAAAVKYNGNDIGNLLDSKLPLSGGTMTGNINLNGSNLEGDDDNGHLLSMGTYGRNYWDFVEYGGDFRFYKGFFGQNPQLLGKITQNGWEGNVNSATPITSANIGSQSVSYANNAGWAQPTFNNATMYHVGDDVMIGDQNVPGTLCIRGVNANGSILFQAPSGEPIGTAIHTGNIGSQSVNYATSAGSAGSANSANTANTADKANKDRVGVDLCTNIKSVDLTFGAVQLNKDQVNPVGFSKPSGVGTVINVIIRRAWPMSTWTDARVSVASFDSAGSINLVTAASQKYDLAVTLLYLDV